MATAVNFIKQLEKRRKEGFGSDVEIEEEGGLGTKLRSLSAFQSDEPLSVGDALLMIIVGVIFFAYSQREMLLDTFIRQTKVAAVDAEIAAIDNELAIQKNKIDKFINIQAEIRAFEQQAREFKEKIQTIEKVRMGRNSVVRMIDQVMQSLPTNVWMSSVSIDIKGALVKEGPSPPNNASGGAQSAGGESSLGNLKLEGYAKNFQDISRFLKELEKIYFFEDLKLEQSESEVGDPKSTALPPETKKFVISANIVRVI